MGSTMGTVSKSTPAAFGSVRETYRVLFRSLGTGRIVPSTADGATAGTHIGVDTGGESVGDIVGWKVATIADPDAMLFNGYSWGTYGVVGAARCLFHNHTSPVFDCSCGFHAYRHRHHAQDRLNRRRNPVLLRVGLYGTIVEHRLGWRAQQQDLLGVHLPSTCSRRKCEQPTTYLHPDGESWRTVCDVHRDTRSISTDTLRRRSGLDVVVDL
jgi:hypothetical protein